MNKIFVILALLISTQIELRAQQEKHLVFVNYATALKPLALPLNVANPKDLYNAASNEPDNDYEYYMRKSKSQRTVGWVTLGSGVVLSGIGLLVAGNSETTVDVYGNIIDDNTATAAVLIIAGGISGIVSIPFMIMASANKHKARVMLKSQPTGFGVPPNVNKNISGITITIPLVVRN